jgi:hypothetical protein
MGISERVKHGHKTQITITVTPGSIEIAENQTGYAGEGIIISRVRIRKTPTRNPLSLLPCTPESSTSQQKETQKNRRKEEKKESKRNRGEMKRRKRSIVCFSPLLNR